MVENDGAKGRRLTAEVYVSGARSSCVGIGGLERA
jgi:hypothetical protein